MHQASAAFVGGARPPASFRAVLFDFPDGTKIPFRLTAVFHQEDGEWKLVQSQTSVDGRNEDLMGHHLPLG